MSYPSLSWQGWGGLDCRARAGTDRGAGYMYVGWIDQSTYPLGMLRIERDKERTQ